MRTLKQIIKSPLRPSTIKILKDLLRNGVYKAPSQHILIWCTEPYGLEIINVMFPLFQKIFSDTLHKMNDCFESARSIQRYYTRAGIFQMDYSITYKLAFFSRLKLLFNFMSRGLYAGKILAPDLTSHTIMALLSRTSLKIIGSLSYILTCKPHKTQPTYIEHFTRHEITFT